MFSEQDILAIRILNGLPVLTTVINTKLRAKNLELLVCTTCSSPVVVCWCVWTGYPRFVINNTPYAPFAPFLPTAADTLPSLLPPGPSATSGAGPPHCHRIYELQKGSTGTSCLPLWTSLSVCLSVYLSV